MANLYQNKLNTVYLETFLSDIRANTGQLELELGLSMAKFNGLMQ